MISIALLEANRAVRERIAGPLRGNRDFQVVTAAATSETLFLPRVLPDVILLDAGSWNRDNLHVVELLQSKHPSPKVIMMSVLPLHDNLVGFVRAGVSGFILSDATTEDVIDTIRRVAAGERVLPSQLTASLFSELTREKAATRRTELVDSVRMTPREHQIIGLIVEGLSNEQIASRLNIASHTVKSHVRKTMEKLGLHSRLQVAAFSRRAARPRP